MLVRLDLVDEALLRSLISTAGPRASHASKAWLDGPLTLVPSSCTTRSVSRSIMLRSKSKLMPAASYSSLRGRVAPKDNAPR